MSIRMKLLLLLGGTGLTILVGLAALHDVQRRQLGRSADNVVRQHLNLAERIVALKSQPLVGMATDYTYWDDMVAFVEAPSNEWAIQNINASLDTFGIDQVWVLRADATVVYVSTHTDAAHRPPLPVPLQQLLPRFAKDKLPHFYAATNDGLLEMVSASIHPTWDKARVSPPTGYLLVGRLWTDDYLQELAALVNAELQLVTVQPPPSVGRSETGHAGRIEAYIPLAGATGAPVAWLKLSARSDYLEDLRTRYRTTFLWVVAICALLLAATALALRQFVIQPLRQLGSALQNESVADLDKLQTAPHEFGQLAQLITQFFIQKRHLEEEIEERNLTQDALRASELKFNQIFDNVPVGLLALDERLHITHLNIAVQKLTGYLRRDLQSEHLSMLIHPEDLGECLQTYREIREHKRLFHRSLVRYLDKDGTVFRVRQTDVGIRSPQGELLFVVSMLEPLSAETDPGSDPSLPGN